MPMLSFVLKLLIFKIMNQLKKCSKAACIYYTVACVLFYLVIFQPISIEFVFDHITSTSSSSQPCSRSAFVTLARSTNRSVMLTINMLHSLARFHSTSYKNTYPILIFHEHDFTLSMRNYILSCVLTAHNHLHNQISFALIDFNSTIPPNIGSRLNKPVSYRMMCRFWSYDVFFHPAIIQGRYKYLMRLDDDSYFSAPLLRDLFCYMDKEKLDYVYRATYDESTPAMLPVERLFLKNRNKVRQQCIYNNFFIINLEWFYKSDRIQAFLKELLRDDRMIREYIGDGCVHAAMLEIERQVKVRRIGHIPYGHNIHIVPKRSFALKVIAVENFSKELEDSCQRLLVLSDVNRKIMKIKMI